MLGCLKLYCLKYVPNDLIWPTKRWPNPFLNQGVVWVVFMWIKGIHWDTFTSLYLRVLGTLSYYLSNTFPWYSHYTHLWFSLTYSHHLWYSLIFPHRFPQIWSEMSLELDIASTERANLVSSSSKSSRRHQQIWVADILQVDSQSPSSWQNIIWYNMI